VRLLGLPDVSVCAERMGSHNHRRLMTRIPVSLIIVMMSGAPVWLSAAGTTRHVDDDTCPAVGSGTPGDPYCSIQDAICASSSGDTVSVAAGTYIEAIRMRPGVSLVSQGGAAVTTLNAAGQPCTDNDFCSKRPGSQCSVVTFASGHTTATVLDGFTITGGAGLIQTTKVAGGGIYVFSSPTIMNNVITNNTLSGPLPQGGDLRGAVVYVAVGEAVISSNVISGNVAIPPAGTSYSDATFGYGGGVWVSYFSAPTVTGNVIHGNTAGDPAVDYSLGSGGGIVVYPGPGPAGPVIDRNLIADNFADTLGGGVSLLSRAGTAALAQVTNNVIVGNTATNGGGVYTYFNKSSTINNTITENDAFFGGGVYSGPSEVALPVDIINNIIESNTLQLFGGGGGIFSLSESNKFDPTISFNDLWANEVNQCGGELTDLDCFGITGNFSDDPLFVDRVTLEYHLDPNSPAIDRALAASAPPVDFDGQSRGFDGDGVPDFPEIGDVDVGAFEFLGCLSAPEVCDGVDNNCNGLVDEGFPDTDGDSLADCVDDDDDDDTVLDPADCAPLDASAFGVPVEVTNVNVTGASPTSVTFDVQDIGTGTHYEIISGLLSRVAATGGFEEIFCLNEAVSAGSYDDTRPAPPEGDGWCYLIGSANACGLGTLGSLERDAAGAGDVCQTGVVDQDGDGSPSDLDCDDTNANLSPINPEICDGLDNNCDLVADEGNPGGGVSCGVSDVGECNLGTTQCSEGSLLCVGEVGPSPEICDGLDNDCNGIADDGLPDTDLDGMADCTDPDDDNDGVLDVSDCAPLDSTAFGMPTEVQDVRISDSVPSEISWTEQSIGSGTEYVLATGVLITVASVDFTAGSCLLTTSSSPVTDPLPDPAIGTIDYYMVKSRNSCGPGTFGNAPRDTHPSCP